MDDTALPMTALGSMTLPAGLEELAFTAQINLRGNPDDPAFMAALSGVLGAEPSREPNRVSAKDGAARFLWLGPDEWLIVAPDEQGGQLIGRLSEALTGQHVALSDVSANRTILHLSGGHALQTLMKSCDVDLHPVTFAPGQVIQTMIAKSQAIIENIGHDSYHIYVRCSFARYVAGWLGDALAEYQD